MNIIENNDEHNGHTVPSQARQLPRRALPRGAKIVSVCLLLLLILVVLLELHRRSTAELALEGHAERTAIPVVNVVNPDSSANLAEMVLPGNTQAFREAPIFARTNGYLKRWYGDIGSRVKQGQLLANIDTPEVDRQLEQARADLKNAQANEGLAEVTATRWQHLLKSDAVSKQETDQAVTDLSVRKAVVASATANVHRLEQLQSFERVFAPFSGVITARNTDVGSLIDAGSSSSPKELFHLADTSRMRVYVSVPEADLSFAPNGAKVTLTLDEYPHEQFEGVIVRDSDSIDPVTRTLKVEVDVDNPQDRIKTGAYVLVHFAAQQVNKGNTSSLLTIPSNALLFRSEGLRVAVVRQGHAELIPVQLGRNYGSKVEVISGLQAGDQVIVNPSDSLTNGTPVNVAASRVGGTSR